MTPEAPPSGTVFVSGASAGFGAAITRCFARSGRKVVAAARRADKLQSLADEFPGLIHPLPLDISRAADLGPALEELPPDFEELDCLVNNAGLALGLGPAATASLSDWERMIGTNCLGLVALTRLVLVGMVARGRGHIVNMGSVAGTYPYPGGNVYGATKAFVHQFSLNLRADLAGTGIRVSCVEPGICGGTEFSETRFGGDRDKAAAVYAGMEPLVSEDIARTIAWIVTSPAHVNVNRIELMPVDQSFGPFAVQRREVGP